MVYFWFNTVIFLLTMVTSLQKNIGTVIFLVENGFNFSRKWLDFFKSKMFYIFSQKRWYIYYLIENGYIFGQKIVNFESNIVRF